MTFGPQGRLCASELEMLPLGQVLGARGLSGTDAFGPETERFASNVEIWGHALDRAQVLVVGATPRDVETADAAVAVAVGVATGKYTYDVLAASADDALPTLESPLPGVPDVPPAAPSSPADALTDIYGGTQ